MIHLMAERNARSTRRTAIAVSLVAVLALLAACGDDGASLRAEGGVTTTTPSPSPGDHDGDTMPGEAGDDTEARAPVVAETSDLPAGWQNLPVDAGKARSCIDSLAVADGPFDEASLRAFAQSSLGAFLVTASSRGGDATLAQVERIVLECDGQTDDSGFTTSVEAADPPDVGTTAVAFRGTATDDRGSSVSYLVASSAVGDTALLVVHTVSLGELDPALVEAVLAAMADRAS